MRIVPLWSLLTSREVFGGADLPLLTVTSEFGVGVRDLSGGRQPSEDLSGYRRVLAGDLVVNKLWARFGAYGVSEHEGVISPAYWVLKIDSRRALPRYLHHLLRSAPYLAEIRRISKDMPPNGFDLPWSQFRKMEVELPPLEEQRRIADFLDTETTRLDHLIQRRERQGVLASEHLDALTFETIRGAREPAPRKPSGVRWIGDVPASWPVAAVSHKFQVDLGKMLNAERSAGPHPQKYLRNANVQWDRIDAADLAEMDFPPGDYARYSLRAGDLLVCEGGEPGRAAVWDGSIEPMYYQKALHRVRPVGDALPRWLYYCLRAATGQDVFAVEGNLTTIAHLTGEQLRAHRFPFPDPATQARLVAELDQETGRVGALRRAMSVQIALLTERRQALITAAVTGQFDVTTAHGGAA